MPTITGNVRYEGVSFAFRQAGPLQLCNLHLEFPAGTFVGIVGQSGSGKSTLTKLLPRLYEPQSGKVVIDGYDISKVELSSLRRQIGMVLQDTLLFDGTIRDNITLSNPDATDEQVIEAAKLPLPTISSWHYPTDTVPKWVNEVLPYRVVNGSGLRSRALSCKTPITHPGRSHQRPRLQR